MIKAIVCPNPFTNRQDVYEVEPGLTVSRIISEYAPKAYQFAANVYIGSEFVPVEKWVTTVPEDGATVTVRVIPRGGGSTGKNILRGVLAITAIAAAVVSSFASGAVLLGAKIVGWTAAGLNLAVGMLTQIPTRRGGGFEPFYSVTGTSNRANLHGVIPKVFGKMKMFPPLGAQPYTEIVGNDQYINVLYCFGYEKLTMDLTTLKCGDDLLTASDDIDFYLGSGFTNDAAETTVVPATFSNAIYETALDNELKYADGWVQHATATGRNAKAISFDLVFPAGLYSTNDDGEKETASVSVEARYRKVGTADWLPNTDPAVEAICPAFSEWTLGGTASYNAGTGVITLAAEADYVESPLIHLGSASEFDFSATFNSTNASTTYTPQGGYYLEISYYRSHSHITENDDDETMTATHAGYDTGGDEVMTYTCTAGLGVKYVKVKIISKAPYTAASYTIDDPSVTRAALYTFVGKTSRAKRESIRYEIPSGDEGQYEVQVRKATGDTSTNVLYWTALRAITDSSPVTKTGVALLAVRARASGSVSGTLDQLSAVVTSNLPTYDGVDTWTNADTQNPAWAFCDILKGAANKHAVADARIDLARIYTWYGTCVIGGYEFNAVIDQPTTVRELLQQVASCGRASLCFNETQYSVTEDKVKSTIVQHFTPRNSWGFTGTKVFRDATHGIKANFINDEADYIEDTRIVPDDGYTESTATILESIDYFGITGPDQIYKRARFDMACARLRPELFQFNADFENLVCQRGDLIAITHDGPMWGLGTARIKSITNSGTERIIAIDDTWSMASGVNYGIQWRSAANNMLPGGGTMNVQTVVGDNTSVTTINWNPGLFDAYIAVGDLIVYGVQNTARVLCLVKEIDVHADLSATIKAVEYNAAVYTADSGTIPAFDSKITTRPVSHRTPPVPRIYQTRSDETVMVRGLDGTYRTRVLIDLVRVCDIPNPLASATDQLNAIPHDIHVEMRESDSDDAWFRLPVVSADNTEISIYDVEDAFVYDFRLRYVSEYGRASEWVYIYDYTVIGKSSLPADIDTINYKQPSRLEWTYTPPLDFWGFEVRYNYGADTDWAKGTAAHDGVLTASYFDIGTFTGGTMTWMVKARDTAGNYSDGSAYIVRDLGDPDSQNVVTTWDLEADGYPGEKVDCTVDTDLKADEEASLFYGPDASLFYDRPTLFYDSFYLAMEYTFPYVPPASNVGCDFWLDYTTTGERDWMYRRTLPTYTADFSGDLTGWTASAGTWTIASEVLTVVHNAVAGGNQTLTWSTAVPALGNKFYVQVRVKSADVSDGTFGVALGAQYYWWVRTKHVMSVDGDTAETVAMVDGTYQTWLFEVLEDDTVNWYVDGNYIDSSERKTSSTTFRFVVAADAVGATTHSFDDLKVWIPAASYAPWAGKVTTAADELYEVRYRAYAGATRGQITALSLKLDVDDILEYQENVAIASGSARITLVNTFTAITNITATIQASGGETAIGVKVNDKQVTAGAGNGPDIECFDAAGNTTAGHVDLKIRGYYSG